MFGMYFNIPFMVRFSPSFLLNSSRLVLVFVFLLFGFSTVKAQTDRQASRTQIGLDLGKTIYYNALPNARGFTFEVPCRFRLDSNFTVMAGVGYGSQDYKNLKFHPEFKTTRKFGFIGLEVNVYKQIGFIGSSYIISRVNHRGIYEPLYYGQCEYYGGPLDFTWRFGSLQVYNLWMIPLSDRFKLGLKLFGMFTPSKTTSNYFYDEYKRNGITRVPTDYKISTGLNVHLYYTFLKKP